MKQKTTRSQDRKELRPAAPAVGSRMLPATKFYNICVRKDEQRDISRFLQHTSDTDSNTTTPGAHISLVAAILIAMMGSAAATHLSSNTERQATISDRRALVENFFRGTISEEGHCFRSYVKGLLATRDASKGRDGTEGRPFNMPNLVLQLLPRTSSFASNPGLRRVCEVLIHDAEVAIRVDGSNGISKNWSEEEVKDSAK